MDTASHYVLPAGDSNLQLLTDVIRELHLEGRVVLVKKNNGREVRLVDDDHFEFFCNRLLGAVLTAGG